MIGKDTTSLRQPSAVISAANGLGECVLWDEKSERLWWTDVPGRCLWSLDTLSEKTSQTAMPEDLCSFAFIEGSDLFLAAFQSGFALLHPETGEHRWLHRIANPESIRLNDGRVDRQGRFWCGSLVDGPRCPDSTGLSGELFCIDGRGKVATHLDGIHISNSICWSPDGATMYFADTRKNRIDAFDFDVRQGELSARREFASVPAPAGPDGSVVDSEGFLWNAQWGQGRVVRYRPDGQVDLVLVLPTSHITCLAFGGSDLSTLYITSATYGLTSQQREQERQAGDVFVYATPYRGLPESRFRSDSIDLTLKEPETT